MEVASIFGARQFTNGTKVLLREEDQRLVLQIGDCVITGPSGNGWADMNDALAAVNAIERQLQKMHAQRN